MSDNIYGDAAVEVLDILNHTEKADVEKIPQSFINFLTDISNKEYKAELDHGKTMGDMNLCRQTREILGFIYVTWWCSEAESQKYKKQMQENSIVYREESKFEYDYNKIFCNSGYIQIPKSNEQFGMVEYKEENIFKKIFSKVFSWFGI